MASQDANLDRNGWPALTAHLGTSGTAETVRLVANSSGQLTTTASVSAPGTQTVGGAASSGAAAADKPVLIAGTDSGGTVYAVKVDTAGIVQTSASLALNTGTITTIVAGTLNKIGTIGVISNVGGGTLDSINTGTIQISAGTIVAGTLNNLASGTLQSSGTTTGVGVVSALTSGSVTVTAGTVVGTFLELLGSTTSSASDLIASTDISNYKWISVQLLNTFVGSVQVQTSNDNTNFNAGNALFNSNTTTGAPTIVNLNGTGVIYHGPIASRYMRLRTTTLTSGTAQAVVELYSNPTTGQGINNPAVTQSGAWNVTGTVAAGTLTNLATGTINALASGTITGGTLGNLNSGTVAINMTPVVIGTSLATVGTTGAAVWGTLVAASGAGTKQYVSGVDVSVVSGTVEVAVTNIGVGGSTGAGVLVRGNFPAGGGISKNFNPIQASGTNGTLSYWLGGAGTVDITIQYWQGV